MNTRAIETGICFRTAYASESIARTKLGQIRRGRARNKTTQTSDRQYEVTHCGACGLWHVSSRNGKG